MKKFKFLVMEDNDNYFTALQMAADKYGRNRKAEFGNIEIDLRHARNFPEAKDIYSHESYTIHGIVLDVVNYRDATQSIADESSLPLARDYFREKAGHLPIVALTGQPGMYDTIKKAWAGSIEVFSKSDDEEKMFAYLIGEVKKLPDAKILKKYPEPFDIAEKYLGADAFGRLLSCIRNMENQDKAAITGTLGNLRKLQEYLYLGLQHIDDKMVPRKGIYSDKGKTRVDNETIIRHLKGNFNPATKTPTTKEYVAHNSHIDRLLNYIYKGCSEEIHVSDQNTTKYTVQSLVFAYMDLLLWLGRIAKEKKTLKLN